MRPREETTESQIESVQAADAQMLKELDSDGDGKLSLLEYLAYVKPKNPDDNDGFEVEAAIAKFYL